MCIRDRFRPPERAQDTASRVGPRAQRRDLHLQPAGARRARGALTHDPDPIAGVVRGDPRRQQLVGRHIGLGRGLQPRVPAAPASPRAAPGALLRAQPRRAGGERAHPRVPRRRRRRSSGLGRRNAEGVLVGTPAHGSASISGNRISYTPAAGYSGADSTPYTIADGNGAPAAPRVDGTHGAGGTAAKHHHVIAHGATHHRVRRARACPSGPSIAFPLPSPIWWRACEGIRR